MKFNGEFWFVAVLFVLVIMVSSYGGSSNFVPYNTDYTKFNGYPYHEGFVNSDPVSPENIQKTKSTGYKTTLLGFEGLFHAPYGDYKQNLIQDPVSHLPSSPDCVGSSNSLSNSTGALCFNSDVQRLFQTRGNNQTGSSFQIGH
jgi:hypothetical protein